MVCNLLEVRHGSSKPVAPSYNCDGMMTISDDGGVYAESSKHGFYAASGVTSRQPDAQCPGGMGAGGGKLPGQRTGIRLADAVVPPPAVQAHAAPLEWRCRAGRHHRF